MIVCLCHGVRESTVEQVVRSGARSIEEVGAACGAGTGCGCCMERLAEKLDECSGMGGDIEPELSLALEPVLAAG